MSAKTIASIVLFAYKVILDIRKSYVMLVTAKDKELSKLVLICTPIAILIIYLCGVSDTLILWILINVFILNKFAPKFFKTMKMKTD